MKLNKRTAKIIQNHLHKKYPSVKPVIAFGPDLGQIHVILKAGTTMRTFGKTNKLQDYKVFAEILLDKAVSFLEDAFKEYREAE